MRVHLLTVRYSPSLGGFDDRPLADFVRDKEVLAVREHFFSVHDLPHLACLVTYQEAPLPAAGSVPSSPASTASGHHRELPRRGRETERPDPFAGLPESDRQLCVSLREWRSTRARKDGVPPYLILTNREIVAVAAARPLTPNALQGLEGIGPGKVERYGAAILAKLHGTPSAPPTTVAPRTPEPQPTTSHAAPAS